MLDPIVVLLPEFASGNGVKTYLKGRVTVSSCGKIHLHILQHSTDQSVLKESSNKESILYGYCGDIPLTRNTLAHKKNHIILDSKLHIKKLHLGGVKLNETNNAIVMLYDQKVFRYSDAMDSSESYLSELNSLLQKNKIIQSTDSEYEPCIQPPFWLTSSSFAQHCLSYFNVIHWMIMTIRRERRISIKCGNQVLAMVADVILGYLFLHIFIIPHRDLSLTLMDVMEKLVNLLYTLLKWLMGAPAGLKLNKAFNNMLGKYFSYHIQLWWLFLDVSRDKLDTILHLYQYVGYLGFTFQAAVISDMASMATFHSYCIYVYAARLFNIQISGLTALLRLFVGRKYNPLRGGIDSCEYTNQELFVGTVGFTILLLLLPTTTMYYIVFTLFRVMSLLVQSTLAKLIQFIQTLPLYVVSLWIIQSPKVAGKVFIEVKSSSEDSPLVLRVKLFNRPIKELINKYKPPVESLKHFQWTSLLSNVVVGKQLV